MERVPLLLFMGLKSPRTIIRRIIGCVYMLPFFLFGGRRYFRQFIRIEELETRGGIVEHLENYFGVGPEDYLLEIADAGFDKLPELGPFLSGRQFQAWNRIMVRGFGRV